MRTSREIRPVLVVDDDAVVRRSMKWLLEGEGYRVATAKNGAEAMSKLRKGLKPCLIMFDLNMPGMDASQFREAQLQDAGLSAIPLVICSGDAAAHAVARRLHVPLFEKPFDTDTILATVQRCCAAA